jgi:tripartite ATP-independent transporter DctP family solute receptor
MDKIWDNGFRQITNNVKPIATVADLSSMKIRVPIGKLWISLFESLGAAPSGISFNEVYSALQTHVVDGQENPLAIASVARLYEVQKYCSLTNHMWDGFWVLSNKNAWNKIPPRLQEIAAKNFNEYAVLQRKDIAEMNSQLRKSLEEKGMAFNTADPASFRDKLRSSNYYANWRKEFGDDAWTLLEKFSGKLA